MGRPRNPELPRRTETTKLLRIPRADWALICTGAKTELRVSGRHAVMANTLKPPTPVVGYSILEYHEVPEAQLLVLQEAWSEPLGAISPESLLREGFASLGAFRRYWIDRHSGQPFKPLSITQVYRLRPWRAGDTETMGVRLVERLYGRWLES